MTGLKLVREMLDKKFDKAKKDYAGKEIDEARYNEIKESYKQADLYLKKNGEQCKRERKFSFILGYKKTGQGLMPWPDCVFS